MHARSSILWLMPALVACHAGSRQAPYAPIAAGCSPDRIGHVTIAGAPREALAPLTVLEGTRDDAARTERIAEIATEGLRAKGYAHATIAIRRELRCGVDLAVSVTLGRRFKIARIEFETEDEFPPAQRLALIEDALGTVNTVGGTYIAYRLQRALPELRRRYEDAGWLQAKIDPPEASYDDAGVVTITIPVRSGPRFKIGNIRAIGTNATTRTAVIDALGVRPGDYYDRASIRSGIERARKQTDRWIDLHVEVSSDRAEIDVDAIVEAR